MDLGLLERRIELATEIPFEIGCASIDPLSREAEFENGRERLQPQNLKVLIALVRRKGSVVTRDQLVEQCWGTRFVGDDVINRSISALRRFAQRAGGFEIETVPRSGYRLVEAAKTESKRARWAIAAISAALLISAAGWLVRYDGGRGEESLPTVAILPISADSSDQNIRGLAQATRASLSYALTEGGYPVTLIEARTARRPPDLLISGDVQRAPSSIKAFVQVEDMRHGVIVYSHRFEMQENLAAGLSDQIGASVAVSLSRAVTLLELDRRHPSDPAVAAQILNAASLAMDNGDVLHAYEVARQLAPREPNSAIAQFSLASETQGVLSDLPRDQRPSAVAVGRAAADRLLTLAPDFGDAYALWCPLHSPIYLRQCEDQMRRGLAVDPDASSVVSDLGAFLNGVGRTNEAYQLDGVSLAKDPLNPFKLARMLRLLEATGHATDAERLFQQSIRWWPDFPLIYWSRLVGIEEHGDYANLERYEAEVDGDKLPLNRDTAKRVLAALRAGDRAGVAGACAVDGLRWTTQFLCMTAFADLGDLDQSFIIANQLFPHVQARNGTDEDSAWLDQPAAFSVAVLSSPAVAPLRRDPRFLKLVDSSLLRYWRAGRPPDFCTVGHEPICASIVNPRAASTISGKTGTPVRSR
jgi:DNA-binding winged helix-turn-helix (wHTH) protein/tetratricopeptide (TPR) repeat protein